MRESALEVWAGGNPPTTQWFWHEEQVRQKKEKRGGRWGSLRCGEEEGKR